MKNKKIKFNVIDFLILLVIVIAVVSVFFRSGLKDSVIGGRSNQTIEVTLRINNVQKETFSILQIDDVIYSQKDDAPLGKITSKNYRPAETYIALDNGEIMKTYIPDRYDIFLTIEGKGSSTKEGNMLNGNLFVASGCYISAYTNDVSFNFEVTDAKSVEPTQK